jgi:hypothetical protein
VAGATSSLALFVAFQALGEASGEGSRALAFAGLVLEREAALLVVLPLSLAAFAVGLASDRRRGAGR